MLPCGMGTLLDKQLRLLNPTRLTLWVRPQLADYCRQRVVPMLSIPATVNEPLDDAPVLLATGRTLHLAQFEMPATPAIVVEEGDLVRFARVEKMAGLGPQDVLARSGRWLELLELPRTMPQGLYVDRIWDLIGHNEEALMTDFVRWQSAVTRPPAGPWHVLNADNTCIGHDVKLAPGCVLDASRGPIVLDVGASIGANAVLEGPCYIGKYARIQPLAVLRPGTTIGAMCKIGGEVANSIFCPFTNKTHDGFVGDSFIGSWVNLGAGTTTSNLKNTYGEISVQIGSRQVKTGRRLLGAMIGDHTKTAIGTRLNAGSYIGYSCLLAGYGLAPKFMPSFSFWTDKGLEKYDLSKALDVARRMLDRRDQQWTDTDEAVMRYIAEAAGSVEM